MNFDPQNPDEYHSWLSARFYECNVPVHCIGGLVDYIVNGTPVGNFLCAVLKNDLVLAACYADDMNRDHLLAYATVLYQYVPMDARSSADRINVWIETGGLVGLAAKQRGEADDG